MSEYKCPKCGGDQHEPHTYCSTYPSPPTLDFAAEKAARFDNLQIAYGKALAKLAQERERGLDLKSALTEGGYNSIRETLALIAEGEGKDEEVYRRMAKAALVKLDDFIAATEEKK